MLKSQVECFIEGDIKLSNFAFYMSDALYYSDDKMAMKVIDTCGKEALQLCGNNQSISTLLRAPLFSSANKAGEKCKDIWTLLTAAPKALLVLVVVRTRGRKLHASCKDEN
jgi:hypothetical protein